MCSVVGCESSRRGAPRFLLPEDPERRLQWVQFLLEVNGMQLKESSWTDIAVCSEHFPGESFVGAGQLSPAAVPSVSIKQEPEEAAWSPDDTDLAASLFEDVKPFENSLSFLEESKPTFDDDASSRSVQPAQKAPTTVSNNIAALLQMEGYYVVNEKCLFELVARSCPSCGSKLQLEKVSYDVILVLKRRCLKCGYKSQWQNLPGASIQEVRRPTEETKATSEDQQLKERCSDDNQWQHRPGAGIQTPEDRSPTEETEDPSEDQQLKQRCSDENQWQNGPGAGIQTPEDRSPTEETEDPLEDQQMEKARRKAFDAAFKLKALDLAAEIGNRAAARKHGIHESMIRRWRQQREELIQCKKTTKAFRGQKSRWPQLENQLEDWVNSQRANGRRVSTVQIRLKAKKIAAEKKIEEFQGGPSWCHRFMRRKALFLRARKTLCPEIPPDDDEKITNFKKLTQSQIAENSIGPQDIVNMDEVPLTFDLPLTRTGNKKGENATGHERTHFTCVLGCTARGQKLPPMVVFKRTTMPKEELPKGIVVKVNEKGWITESLMKEWLTECYGKRPGGFFHRKKALLVLDSTRAHVTESVRAAIEKTNSIPAVIPAGTTKYLHPLDISVNRAFKVALRVQWEAWMTSGEKSFAKTRYLRKATFAQVCRWVLTAWSGVTESTITNGFRKAGLLRAGEDGAGPGADLPRDESDIDGENENEPGKASDATILKLFNSDTEDDNFSGFSEPEEDGDQ